MSKRHVQLNIYWNDPSVTEGLNYVDGYEKRNFSVSTEAELEDVYDQLKQLLVDFFNI